MDIGWFMLVFSLSFVLGLADGHVPSFRLPLSSVMKQLEPQPSNSYDE